MGPQPSSRGNNVVLLCRLNDAPRFNGAATFQSRKFRSTFVHLPGIARASMGPQPSSRGNSPSLRPAKPRQPASMGPQPSSRGNGYGRSAEMQANLASMGPQPSSRGNELDSAKAELAKVASMGPQPSSRGNMRRAVATHFTLGALQWGRNLPVAEIAVSQPSSNLPSRFNGAATFQSRKCSPSMLDADTDAGFNGAATFQSRK